MDENYLWDAKYIKECANTGMSKRIVRPVGWNLCIIHQYHYI